MRKIKNYLPIFFIFIVMLIAYFSGLFNMMTIEELKKYRSLLVDFVHMHPLIAPLIFICFYILIATFSLPIGIYVTFLGGFLFHQPWSTLYVVIGATLGGSCLFLAARSAFRDLLYQRAAPFLSKMQKGFQKHAWSYMLFLRLIPIFPFWLVNLAPAFFNVPFFTFFWTTAVGIIPATYVFTQVGAGLGAILDTEGPLNLDHVLNWDVKIALLGLGILALLPILFRKNDKPPVNDD